MNLMPQILRHLRHRNQLLHDRDDINRKISVLTNGINTLRFIQKIKGVKMGHSNEPSLFVVRFYDGFDDVWMNISEPVTKERAKEIWDEKTKDGTVSTEYRDIDYYRIFPAE